MRIVEITRERFQDWRRMRRDLYGGLDRGFHEAEMELIFSSAQATCFIGLAESEAAVAMLEVSLRNFVDGCLGGPVGYLEGIYVIPEQRKRGYGRELAQFAVTWFRSRGCRDMAADAELTNLEAQAFLRKVGFDETYRIVEYKRSLEAPKSTPVLSNPLLLHVVDELDIAAPTLDALKAINIYYIGDLIQRTEAELLKAPGISRRIVQEIRKALRVHGLDLGRR